MSQEEPIKILFAGINYAPEMTGIAPYTTGMSDSLADSGHEIQVVTTFPHYPAWRFDGGVRWASTERRNGVVVRRVRHLLPRRASAVSRLLSEVVFGLRLVSQRWNSPDVVVLVSPALFASALGTLRARLTRQPVVIWVQDLYALGVQETGIGGGSGLALRFVRAVEGWVLRSAQTVVVIHERFVDSLLDLGVDAEKALVVRNWSHVRPPGQVDRAAVRQRFGWRPDETIVLHTGNMGVKQDLGSVVDAARLADAEHHSIRFVLMGDGSERFALEKQAAGTGMQFLRPQAETDYMTILSAADVLLVNEASGLRAMALPSKLTSYFASGRPVVAATNEASITAEELEVSGAGLRIDAESPRALVDAVISLREDPEKSVEFGRAGQRYRELRLTESAAAGFLLERLTQLVGARSGIRRSRKSGSSVSTSSTGR